MTRNLHEDLDRLSAQNSVTGGLPPEIADAVVARGRRHQRVRASVVSVGSAAVLAGVAFGALSLPDGGEDQTPATPEPTAGEPEIVRYSNLSVDHNPSLGEVGWCDSSVPDVHALDQGLSVETIVSELSVDPAAGTYDPDSGIPHFVPTVRLTTATDLGAIAAQVGYVIVDGDAVVAEIHDSRALQGFRTTTALNAAESIELGSHAFGTLSTCDETDLDSRLADGEYIAYPIVSVSTGAVQAAAYVLEEAGADLATITDFAPEPDGTYCREYAENYDGRVPIACLDQYDFNPFSQTVEVEVPADLLVRDMELVLVAEPVPFIWEDPWGPYLDLEEIAWPAAPSCGDVFSTGTPMTMERFPMVGANETGATIESLMAGELVPVTVGAHASRDGTVVQDAPAETWLVTHGDEWGYQQIVGRGTLTIGNGEPVPLDSSAGPTDSVVQLSGATWCGEAFDDAEWLSVVSLDNAFTFETAEGTLEREGPITFWFGYPGPG